MTFSLSEIPPGLRGLYEAAGPVIRYRLLRDVLERDESYVQTAHLGLDLARHGEVAAIVEEQRPDGTWHGLFGGLPGTAQVLTTERALLRLCELGREGSEAVSTCVEKVLLPTLLAPDALWEFDGVSDDPVFRRAARHLVRDKALRLIARATREADAILRPELEVVMAEWEQFLSAASIEESAAPPTADAWAALCWFPWPDEELPRVHALAQKLYAHAERMLGQPQELAALFSPQVFQLAEKWEYLARPHDMLRDLELAARLGVVRELDATSWMLEELEAHQDADGLYRFDFEGPLEADWYFPLESRAEADFPVEWSFRAALIFKLLEYDI